MKKSLKEQWQEDCERLSEPHLQWEWKQYYMSTFLQCKSIDDVDWLLRQCSNINIRRIQSLALPFNYKDANNGGKVEVFNSDTNQWDSLGFNKETQKYDFGIFEALDREENKRNKKIKLRMKESRLKTTRANYE